MALESRIAATNRRRPPQSGHSSTSMSSPRRMSSAQVRLCESMTFFGILADDAFSTCGRHPWTACGLALPEAPAANKPKALSAASGDWDIFDVLQSHILPGTQHGPN